MADRLSGKASYFVFDGAQVPITKATLKMPRKDEDTTDNGDYNSSQDVITPTQLIVSVQPTFDIEGRYRKSVIPSLISNAILQSNPGGLPAVLGLDASTVAGHGNFDITDFEVADDVMGIVTYTASMKCNGPFTANS
jgi:hypothetical protein